MKLTILLAFLSLSPILNTVHATEENVGVGVSVSDDTAAYCDEQAQFAGIEDADEKRQFVKDCMESYGVSSGDSQ